MLRLQHTTRLREKTKAHSHPSHWHKAKVYCGYLDKVQCVLVCRFIDSVEKVHEEGLSPLTPVSVSLSNHPPPPVPALFLLVLVKAKECFQQTLFCNSFKQ